MRGVAGKVRACGCEKGMTPQRHKGTKETACRAGGGSTWPFPVIPRPGWGSVTRAAPRLALWRGPLARSVRALDIARIYHEGPEDQRTRGWTILAGSRAFRAAMTASRLSVGTVPPDLLKSSGPLALHDESLPAFVHPRRMPVSPRRARAVKRHATVTRPRQGMTGESTEHPRGPSARRHSFFVSLCLCGVISKSHHPRRRQTGGTLR